MTNKRKKSQLFWVESEQRNQGPQLMNYSVVQKVIFLDQGKDKSIGQDVPCINMQAQLFKFFNRNSLFLR